MKHSKRTTAYRGTIKRTERYSIADAMAILTSSVNKAKFDESVEIHISLGIDPRKGDQLVRGTVTLPHGTGKDKKVVVFCGPDQEKNAKAAGAAIVGGEELINEIKTTEKCDFDIAIATPDMMKALAPIARILGQKGLMPNPKNGTVTDDVASAVKELKGGKVAFKNDSTANIHQIIGKISFGADKLAENCKIFVDDIKKMKPESVKSNYIKMVTVCSTMSPGIKISW